MARDYKQAKIYCIKVNTDNEYLPYVGSSCKRLLSQRMNQHRHDYKQWKKNPEKYGFLSSFTLFEKFGIQNCFIELIELFPCKCNDELRKQERVWFDKIECCNQRKPYRSEEEVKDYDKARIRDKEQKKEYDIKYREEHKEEIIIKNKEYCQKNKEQISEKKRKYMFVRVVLLYEKVIRHNMKNQRNIKNI